MLAPAHTCCSRATCDVKCSKNGTCPPRHANSTVIEQQGEEFHVMALMSRLQLGEGDHDRCGVCRSAATKRCVPCHNLYCELHLKVHSGMGHLLTEATVDCCLLHGKPIELYCMEDESMMCMVCNKLAFHASHNVQPLEEVQAQLKASLGSKVQNVVTKTKQIVSCLQQIEDTSTKQQEATENFIEEIKVKQNKLNNVILQFVNQSLENILRQKSESDVILDKQKQDLQDQQQNFVQIETDLQKALHKQNVVTFLQEYKKHHSRLEAAMQAQDRQVKLPAEVKNEVCRKDLMDLFDNVIENYWGDKVKQTFWLSQYGRVPTIDEDTAYEHFVFNSSKRTVQYHRRRQNIPESSRRFTSQEQVLAVDNFSSGRHYWEVDIISSWCRVGVAYSFVDGRSKIGDNCDSWCVEIRNAQYSALHGEEFTQLSISGLCQRVGLYLDYEDGRLECYIAETMTLLHTFKARFHDRLYPALGLYHVDDYLQFSKLQDNYQW
uniref:E3 ubiquitin-protein ligase TRIM7-like isoform X2 n=1 Tax=Myxine glutinosa TaxID=7769 RepID=UPI00358E6E8B